MFDTVALAPPDPILGLTEAFLEDPNPDKINLSVGVYRDDHGQTPVLRCVKRAEERILAQEMTKAYKPIDGAREYGAAVQRLLFGADHEVVTSRRMATAHTPGGTGALRVAADYLKKMHPGATVWVSDPTWANHPSIFSAAGLPVRTYPYFDPQANGLAFDEMMGVLDGVPAGDVVLLHACCHNPTGIDPTPQQWSLIADRAARQGFLPLVDCAYQGFASGLHQDTAGVRALCGDGREAMICSSFSKNFGLYNERVGALTVVAASHPAAQAVMSQMKVCIRCSYSNPPAHGGAIVTTVLDDPQLRGQWESQIADMRTRINAMRRLFVQQLAAGGVDGDYSFIARQKGMFSLSGLTRDQVQALRQKHAIYVVGSGRINVAGMTEKNMDRLCQAIVEVLRNQP